MGSILLWLTGKGVWRYAVLELFGLCFFYLRWSAPEPQHRQFHFLLMCSYLTTTALYAYRLAMDTLMPGAFAMSPRAYQFTHNFMFFVELVLVIGYAFLYRRARANRAKYYADVDGWFAKAGAARRGAVAFVRRAISRERKQ